MRHASFPPLVQRCNHTSASLACLCCTFTAFRSYLPIPCAPASSIVPINTPDAQALLRFSAFAPSHKSRFIICACTIYPVFITPWLASHSSTQCCPLLASARISPSACAVVLPLPSRPPAVDSCVLHMLGCCPPILLPLFPARAVPCPRMPFLTLPSPSLIAPHTPSHALSCPHTPSLALPPALRRAVPPPLEHQLRPRQHGVAVAVCRPQVRHGRVEGGVVGVHKRLRTRGRWLNS